METTIITPEEIKADYNYCIGIELEHLHVYLQWNGGKYMQYYAFVDGKLLFEGNDFKPSPLNYPDSLATLVDLIGFLTVQRGDTDPEYFAKYTEAQFAWSESHACEEVKVLISDYEDKKSEGFRDAYHNLVNALVTREYQSK